MGRVFKEGLVCLFIATAFVDPALATETAMRADTTAFGGVTEAVYDLVDGVGATLIGLVGGLTAVIALARQWNGAVALGGLGVGVGATQDPEIVLALSGTALLP